MGGEKIRRTSALCRSGEHPDVTLTLPFKLAECGTKQALAYLPNVVFTSQSAIDFPYVGTILTH